MSRTYKRTAKGQKRSWLPNIWSRNHRDPLSFWEKKFATWDTPSANNWRKRMFAQYEWMKANPHRLKDVDDYFKVSKRRHIIKVYDSRRLVRDTLTKIKKGEIDPDDCSWPVASKIFDWD